MPVKIKEFLELEAEEGSDNEDHDHLIKKKVNKIDYQSQDTKELDKSLDELIDNDGISVTKSDRKNLRNKFIDDELAKDEEDLKKIQNFQKGIKRKWKDVICDEKIKYEDNNLHKKRKFLKDRNATKNELFVKNKKNNINISKCKKTFLENNENTNNNIRFSLSENDDELNHMLLSQEKEAKKKIYEESSSFKKQYRNIIKENNIIMQNVINLNSRSQSSKSHKLNKNNIKPYNLSSSSLNSILNAKRNDKYFISNQDLSNNENQNINKPNNIFPCFKNSNPIGKINSAHKNKISAIFK